ncbi:MAG: GIY-YIG nuclease family protein [Alphaproteobacteria bacterium]
MFATYILASQRNGTIYVGSTDDLARRVWEHREKLRQGFTTRYNVSQLVWFESHETRESAFRRERRIKEWRRSWKVMLIEAENPDWRDLYESLAGGGLKAEDWLSALDDGSLDERLGDL